MSLLVSCKSCERVYDASGRAIDSRFRCHCGEVVTVTLPKETNGHDAAVVRCSSCGAPRQGNASACTYCHADFTLHEQDLHTVCPKCFARVSDKGSFCHSCGEDLRGESCASLGTELNCPNCGDETKLQQRAFGKDKQLFECASCTGMWVRNGVLKEILKQAKDEVDEFGIGGDGPQRPLQSTDNRPEHAPIYKSCPDCKQHMRRHIFAKKSGIVIDSCKEHGVWFDPQELELILNWVRAGGSASADDQSTPKPNKSASAKIDIGYQRTERSYGSPISEVLDEAFSAISRYFFR